MSAPATRAFAPWLWAVPFAILALGAPLWLQWGEPAWFLALNQAFAVLPAGFWTALSLMGNAWGVLGLTAPLLVLAPRYLWAWLCAAPFAMVLARLGKGLIESPRPAAVVDNTLMRIVGEPMHNVSMPSGHTLTAFAVASAIYFALPPQRRLRFAWLWLLALATGLSRIAVGAHWPGDVVVGAALGLLCGLWAQALLARVPPAWLQASHTSLRCVALLMLAAVYNLCVEALDFAENQSMQYLLAGVIAVSLVAFIPRSWRGPKPL
ncbi:phosphatase PAP2 family protein [Curvibacter sp. APW13]|uniref:phosphatase PAP2 family protein n=1 Tax=Curvibacter sp. APW13 TaxID=3077236 RepID=UPI0028DD4AF2|nr:phosphatase PAP2 family protein [Curvibacter sp. APW13]MDT8990008.1 phosphatase PAP2 family protein [Curvibacter sp. APW13]